MKGVTLMKKLISFFLALTILLAASCAFAEEPAANSAIRYEGAGFDTPEDAVACYMNGLKNLDFEQMLSAYAWETLASHYSVEKFLQRIKAYIPTSYVRMPAANDFMVSATLHSLRAAEVRMIYNALEAYILGEDYPDGKAIPLQEKDVEAFLQKFDNGKLEALTGMSDITFLTPDSVTDNKFSLEQNQEALKKQTAQYGADELVNIVATAFVGDGTIICMPTVARYGDRWYMVSVNSITSMILGVDMNHQAFMFREVKPEDFFR